MFAQRVQECLFDHSLDSYKAPVHNTHTRCQELLATIADVEAGALASKNLLPICEELAESIRTDQAASTLLGHLGALASDVAWWHVDDLTEIGVRARIVLGRLWQSAYYGQLVIDLKRTVATGEEKDRISRLAADWVVELIGQGFSRQFIYFQSQQYFFRQPGPRIESPDYLDSFLAVFDREPIKCDVCFRGSKSWLLLKDALSSANIDVNEVAPAARTNHPSELEYLQRPHPGAFLTFRGVVARDAASARDIAAAHLNKIFEIVACHIHRKLPTWDQKAIVWWSNRSVVLDPPKAPIQMEEDVASAHLLQRLARTIMVHGPQPEAVSWRRLSASLGLHSAALTTQDPAVQVASLWAALESLIPSPADASKIGGVAKTIIPVLSQGYIEKLLADLDESLRSCAPAAYELALASVEHGEPGTKRRMGAFVALEAHEEQRRALYTALEGNPLLRHRLFRLHGHLSRADRVLELLSRHQSRVDWHLRRIYRTRNLLMHVGGTTQSVRQLVENLHSYFHVCISRLESLFADGTPPVDTDAAFALVRLRHYEHLRTLKEAKNARLDAGSLDALLFGPS